MTRYAILSLLVACSIPHVDPLPRNEFHQTDTVVLVESQCSMMGFLDEGHSSTGVIISEAHVITAAHTVRCGDIPNVHVTLRDGRRFRVNVERDDVMYGKGTDLARLEIASLDRFELRVAPPELDSTYEGSVTIRTWNRDIQSMLYGDTAKAPMYPGDSGSPVYSTAGRLVGLVTMTGATVQRVGTYWMEDT